MGPSPVGIKSVRSVLLLLAVFLAIPFAAAALDPATLKPQGYVSDFAGVVGAQSKLELESYCGRVERATGVQMAFVTINSLEGDPAEDFANDLYRRWGIGQKGTDEGLLLLLVVQERRSRLEVGRGLEEYITDATAGSLLRQMRAPLQQGQYGVALLTAAEALAQRVAQAKSVQIPEASPQMRRRPPPQVSSGDIPWPLILGAIFFLLMMMGKGGRRGGGGGGFLPGMILGSMLGGGRSGYGGYSGGGFGGYDSGDSFGGFGGGDSGGGGASSDW